MKIRLDKLLVDRAMVTSRERAQALILAGRVMVAEQKVDKPGASVPVDAALRILGDDLKYVSRGGLKLEGALRDFDISVAGLACADIGASTGGFTDCMLQQGATSVLAVDTGYGQIAHSLRVDPRVTLLERTNARLLQPGQLVEYQTSLTMNEPCHPDLELVEREGPASAPADLSAKTHRISFFAMDVSFISATLVIPAVLSALATAGERWHGEAVILVKPQFEAGREHVGKGGIVRDPAAHQLAIKRLQTSVTENGGTPVALIDSPILGTEGNKEFLLHARF
jgi:23S rRNA (cytidine1920-2'-O)/16S rRNA (cytidine1409-2'-O)-methyltransferase